MSDDTPFARAVASHAAKATVAQAEAIESACEASIRDGKHGVLLVRYPNGDIMVVVHPSVPYGCIHEIDAPNEADR